MRLLKSRQTAKMKHYDKPPWQGRKIAFESNFENKPQIKEKDYEIIFQVASYRQKERCDRHNDGQ